MQKKAIFKKNCNISPYLDCIVMTFFKKTFVTFAKLSRTAKQLRRLERLQNTLFMFKYWSTFRKTMFQLLKMYRSQFIRPQNLTCLMDHTMPHESGKGYGER